MFWALTRSYRHYYCPKSAECYWSYYSVMFYKIIGYLNVTANGLSCLQWTTLWKKSSPSPNPRGRGVRPGPVTIDSQEHSTDFVRHPKLERKEFVGLAIITISKEANPQVSPVQPSVQRVRVSVISASALMCMNTLGRLVWLNHVQYMSIRRPHQISV